MPVNTIAMPRSSAAAITSASRMLPPGWMTAAAPAVGDDVEAVAERKERVGRHHRARRATSPAFCALIAAMRARIDAAHLAGADAERACRRGRTRWRSTSRTWRRARRTAGRAARSASARAASRPCSSRRVDVARVGRLHQQAAADALHVARVGRALRRAALRARARWPSCASDARARRRCTRARSALRANCSATASAVGGVDRRG